MRTCRSVTLIVSCVAAVLSTEFAYADAIVRVDSNGVKSKIKEAIAAFRDDIGGGTIEDGGGHGLFGSVRREINWDGVGAQNASPNNLAADFFNTNPPLGSPRGVVFSTPGAAVQVSTRPADNSGVGVNFGNINPNYSTAFLPFSGERLFTAIDSNVVDVDFFVAGTTQPATTKGFGVIFSDIDTQGSTTVEYFDTTGASLGRFVAPRTDPDPNTGSPGFSFLGVSFTTEHVARVRITSGNSALGTGIEDAPPTTDLVVMDDFIYGEPAAAPAIGALTVVSPNGGESFAIGAAVNFTWTPTGSGGTVAIELSRNNGATYEQLTASTPDDGSETITVLGPASNECLFRVRSNLDAAVSDVSNAAFTVTGPVSPTPTPNPTGADTSPKADLTATVGSSKIVAQRNRSVLTGSVVVKNDGTAAAGSFTVDIIVSTKTSVGKGSTLVLRQNVGGLATGASTTIPFKTVLPVGRRLASIEATIDTRGTVVEVNEANNYVVSTVKASGRTK